MASARRLLLLNTVFLLNTLLLCTADTDDDFESTTPNSTARVQSPVLDADYFITVARQPIVSGLRVEDGEEGNGGFIGYTDNGVAIVQPGTAVHLWIFGYWLEEVAVVTFTTEHNCSHMASDVGREDFLVQTDRHILIKYEFHYIHKSLTYKVCIQPRARETVEGRVREAIFFITDDRRAAVSTEVPPRKYYFPKVLQIAMVVGLLLLSALFSGLTLGLMSLTPKELAVISKSGSSREARYAETILTVRRNGNFLLCTLLIGNVFVNSAISILIDNLTSGLLSLVVSSAFIVFLGEIFPQALCVRKGLEIGAYTIWATRFFMVLASPLSYPTSKLLDCMLGAEISPFDRKRLIGMMQMSTEKGTDGQVGDEFRIAIGAMELIDKTVESVMTLIDDAFMVSDSVVLNTRNIIEILRMGFNRIPVYAGEDRNSVVGLLFVRDLALLNPGDNFTVKMLCELNKHVLRMVNKGTPLRVMLDEFKKGEYHLAMVQSSNQKLVGLVTLEDIVEEIIQAEILDESDAYMDNVERRRRRRVHPELIAPHMFLPSEEKQLTEASDKHGKNGRRLQTVVGTPGAVPHQASMQMRLAAMHWLASSHALFHPTLISETALGRLVKECVRRVDSDRSHHNVDVLTGHRPENDAFTLYTKHEPSRRFVLILEGRALVTIGEEGMLFEAGPWFCFGRELCSRLLDRLLVRVLKLFGGALSRVLKEGFCRHGQLHTHLPIPHTAAIHPCRKKTR